MSNPPAKQYKESVCVYCGKINRIACLDSEEVLSEESDLCVHFAGLLDDGRCALFSAYRKGDEGLL